MRTSKLLLAGLLSVTSVFSTFTPITKVKAEEPAIDLTNGLVGHWDFEGDTAGAKTATNKGAYAADWDGKLDEGSVVNIMDSNDTSFGKVLHFNPKENATAKGMLIAGTTNKFNAKKSNFTFSFWIKNTTGYDARTVILQQTGAGPTLLNLESGGKYSAYFNRQNDNYVTGNTKDSEWQLITITKENHADNENATVKGYVNGALDKTLTLSLAQAEVSDSDLYVGRHKNEKEATGQFQGDMDDLRYYNRAITEREVQAIYEIKAADIEKTSLQEEIVKAQALLKSGEVESNHGAYIALKDAIIAANNAILSNDLSSIKTAATTLAQAVVEFHNAAQEGPVEADITRGLIGFWNFDGSNALENLGSDAGLRAVLQGSKVAVVDSGYPGIGKTLHFDTTAGDSDRSNMTIANAMDSGANEFSISMLVKRSQDRKMTLLQQSGAGRSVLISNGTSYTSFMPMADVVLGEGNQKDTWEHVTLVKTGTQPYTLDLYVNGVLAGSSGELSANLVNGMTDLIFGSHKSASDVNFAGDMDSIRYYDRAITKEEISLLYTEHKAVLDRIAFEAKKQEVQNLITTAQDIYNQNVLPNEEQVRIELKAAIEHACEVVKAATQIESLEVEQMALQTALDAYNNEATILTIYTEQKLRKLEHSIFGINHRYGFNGYGSFDSEAMKVKDDFTALYDQAGFGSLRYPGGTISNLFNWKTSIGPKEERVAQIHGFYNNAGQHGLAPNFGLSEVADFVQANNSELVYVYGLGRGDANDAADLIEYLNAEVGSNPNGGIAWAEVRAANGHADPFNVRYFEIGNEMNQGGADGNSSQQYWTAYVNGGPENAYINGGVASFNKQYAVAEDDWNVTASKSDGSANQTFYMRYARIKEDKTAAYTHANAHEDAVVKGSVHVYVNDEEWTLIEKADMDKQTAQSKVAWIDYTDGSIHFGDGVHGAIPESTQQIKVDYQVVRDGFVQVSKAMRDTMAQINEYNEVHGASAKEFYAYTSFESNGFVEKMHAAGLDHLYDGMTIHPYSGTPAGGSSSEEARESFYWDAMKKGNNQASHVKSYVDRMRQYDETKVPVISEYGIFRSTDAMVRSQTHALYIARAIMEYIELGSPYIQKHCLVDWYSSGADSLGPTQQAVIQAVPMEGADTSTGEGEYKFFSTPSARVFEMLNSSFGNTIVESSLNAQIDAQKDLAQYSYMSSIDEEGNVYLAIVNLNLTETNAIKVAVDGMDLTGKSMELQYISGETFYTENTLEQPDNVAVQKETVVITGAYASIPLLPHSFTVVKIINASEEIPVVDTSKLSAWIQECSSLDSSAYTEVSWNVLANALKLAKAAMTSNNQAEIDQAVSTLKAAKAGLIEKTPTVVDTSALQKEVESAVPAQDALRYTASSWEAYQASLSKAKQVLASDNSTQAEIDSALHALQAARKALELVKVEDMITLEDKESGVYITGSIDPNATLRVENLTMDKMKEILVLIQKEHPAFAETKNIERILDLQILCNDEVYLFDGALEVKIKLHDAEVNKEGLGIIFIDENGKIQTLPSRVENGYIIFTVSHFSKYAIVSDVGKAVETPKEEAEKTPTAPVLPDTPNTGTPTSASNWIFVMLLSAALCMEIKRRRIHSM